MKQHKHVHSDWGQTNLFTNITVCTVFQIKIPSPNSTNSLPVLVCLNLPSFLSTKVHDEFCIQTFQNLKMQKKSLMTALAKKLHRWGTDILSYIESTAKKSIQNKIYHYKLYAEQKVQGEIRVKHHVASEVSWGPDDLATDGAPDKGRGENLQLNFWGNPLTFSGKQNKKN